MSEEDESDAVSPTISYQEKKEIAKWFLLNAPAGEIKYVAKGRRLSFFFLKFRFWTDLVDFCLWRYFVVVWFWQMWNWWLMMMRCTMRRRLRHFLCLIRGTWYVWNCQGEVEMWVPLFYAGFFAFVEFLLCLQLNWSIDEFFKIIWTMKCCR